VLDIKQEGKMSIDLENCTDTLERLIDRHGLVEVTVGLELVCSEKAEHLRVNWQDAKSAKPWESAARRFIKLARELIELGC
jgi:hypothetical protein